jgi:hypothetical protein
LALGSPAFAGYIADPTVRTALLFSAFVALVLCFSSAADIELAWKPLLTQPLRDEWQHIFGVSLNHPARPAETWAQKLAAFDRVVRAAQPNQPSVPIFLSADLLVLQLPAIAEEQRRIGIPLVRVPLLEALRLITSLTDTRYEVTDYGILISRIPNSR